jgi:hypothetical protein
MGSIAINSTAIALMVYLQNADTAAFNNLIAQIETLTGSAGTTSRASGYSNYELAYNFSGALFALSLVHTNGIAILRSVTVILEMDVAYDEIVVAAIKY